MGGKSSKMQPMRASAKPAFRSLTLKVSIAFETVQVSKRRRASSSSARIAGSTAMRPSLRRFRLTLSDRSQSRRQNAVGAANSVPITAHNQLKQIQDYALRKDGSKNPDDGGGRLYRLSM